MDYKKVSEYPQAILNLFQQHHNSQSDFMARAGRGTFGGLTAGAIFKALSANTSLAQGPILSPHPVRRVAVIGSGHYHATAAPGYLHILQNLHLDIVGVHAFDPAVAKDHAALVGSTAYSDYKLMCEKTKPDFVLSLCRHYMMPDPIRYLINADIPFMAEKPWGTDAKTVNDLADLAEKKNAWATFPTPMRYTQWAQTCREMVQKKQLGPISHMIIRFNQPGIQRYIDEGSSWMLSKKEAGGGCLLNLGIHGFDLCTYITGEIPKVVAASTSHNFFNLSVEDYAFVTLRTPSGMIFINEAGYTYPAKGSDSERMLTAKNFLIGTPGNVGILYNHRIGVVHGIGAAATGRAIAEAAGNEPRSRRTGGRFVDAAQIVGPGRNETVNAPPGYVGSWAGTVAAEIDRLRRGLPPAATAADNARAVTLTFDAYRMAGEKS